MFFSTHGKIPQADPSARPPDCLPYLEQELEILTAPGPA